MVHDVGVTETLKLYDVESRLNVNMRNQGEQCSRTCGVVKVALLCIRHRLYVQLHVTVLVRITPFPFMRHVLLPVRGKTGVAIDILILAGTEHGPI